MLARAQEFMNRQRLSVLWATAIVLPVLCSAISASQSEPPKSPTDDGILKALAAVAGAGTMENDDYEFLRELSDDIGARVTGSPEAAKAIAWGAEKMRAVGLENVHAESWQLFRGWTRMSADAELLSPVHRRMMIDSMGWAGSTPHGGVEAELVAVNAYQLVDLDLAASPISPATRVKATGAFIFHSPLKHHWYFLF